MSLKLYFHPLASFCHKALVALYENGVAFEPVIVDLLDETSSAALRALWPMAKMPVLRDDARDRTVAESTIVVEYLDAYYPGATRFLPADPDDAWQTRMWDRFFDHCVQEPMQKIVTDRLRPAGKNDAYGVEQAKEQLQQAYAVIEREIAGRTWMMGDAFTLADCARFAMQNDLPRRHHVRRYGLHDHLVHTAEARRLQAEAIAKGARWVWTNTRRALQRLTNGKSREQTPAANGKQVFKTLGRASVADAFRRDRQRLGRLVRRFILEPYARRRRRRIAIAQLRALDDRLLADIGLTRGQIERAVDGKLARRGEILTRPCAPLARKRATGAAPRSRSVVAAKTERGGVAPQRPARSGKRLEMSFGSMPVRKTGREGRILRRSGRLQGAEKECRGWGDWRRGVPCNSRPLRSIGIPKRPKRAGIRNVLNPHLPLAVHGRPW